VGVRLTDDACMGKRRSDDQAGPGKRFFLMLLGLAGLGVGVWLFRSRRRKT
jgi:LPXTG-motif cell wall-anchored protein